VVVVVIIALSVQKAVRMMLRQLLDQENAVLPEILFRPEDRMMMRQYQRNMYHIIPLISQITNQIIRILMMTFKKAGAGKVQ
jgi:hypothetical protein